MASQLTEACSAPYMPILGLNRCACSVHEMSDELLTPGNKLPEATKTHWAPGNAPVMRPGR